MTGPAARRVDLSDVVSEQAMTIGTLHTNLTMANLTINALEQENAELRERLAVTDEEPDGTAARPYLPAE